MLAPLMIALGLVFALMVAARQPSSSTESQMTIEPPAHAEYERHKQAAIRINELAGQVHSQADANLSCLKSRLSLRKNCLRLGQQRLSASELPALSTRRFATERAWSLSSA